MGWHGGHLHCFSVDLPVRRYIPRYYFLTHWDIEVDDNHDGIPESDVQIWEVLSARGDKVTYHYDFGDGWKHRLRFEKTEPWEPGQPLVSCLAGRRACPPEDCGGLWRYYEVLASLGPAGLAGEPERSEGDESEWFEEAWGWMRAGFAPEAFDIDEANDRLAAAEARDFTSERYL
jgi:hypothetical protein